MRTVFRASILLGLSAVVLAAAEPATLAEAITSGKFSLAARARYENVQQTGLLDANALTLRTRLGFTTAKLQGWQLSAEGENVAALDGDAYSQAGLNPAAARRAVVADPETTELNQLWLGYTTGQTTATVGRQRWVLDQARFVGDVGWRQDQQTFDAAVLQDKTFARTTLAYGYIDQVNRVFSRRHAQGRWDSDSHLLHGSYAGWPVGTVSAYAYLLDFENAAANSCATYGLSLAGTRKLGAEFTLAYRAEFATQSDYGASRLDYSARYAAVELGLSGKRYGLAAGHEVLGSDRAVGFKTPLATLHAYNGWADLFLATPAAGLRDTYAKATATLPGEVALTVFQHWFEADAGGGRFGRECDALLSRKFGRGFTAAAKYADFRRDSPAFPNVRKVWLQVEFTY